MHHVVLLQNDQWLLGSAGEKLMPATALEVRAILGTATFQEARRNPGVPVKVVIETIANDVQQVINGNV